MSIQPSSRNDDTTLANELVISHDQVRALRGALDHFRELITKLVRTSGTTTTTGLIENALSPYFELVRMFSFSRVFSSSVFGRSLTYDELVGQYANLWPTLERGPNLVYSEMALFGVLALRAQRLKIAQSILEDVQFATSTPVALTYVIRGVVRFVAAAGMAMYLLVLFAFWAADKQLISWKTVSESEPFQIGLATLFG